MPEFSGGFLGAEEVYNARSVFWGLPVRNSSFLFSGKSRMSGRTVCCRFLGGTLRVPPYGFAEKLVFTTPKVCVLGVACVE